MGKDKKMPGPPPPSNAPPPRPNVPPPPPAKRVLPVFLSAFVAPGAGQLAQKRYLAGGFYLIAFLVAFFQALRSLFQPMMQILSMDNLNQPLAEFSFRAVFIWLGAALGIYLVSLFDTWMAERKKRS